MARWWARVGVLVAVVWVVVGWLRRVRPLAEVAAPRPVHSYADALARLAALQAEEGATINPVCRTRLLTQGRKVERAIVLLHGFTNCPQQFCQLAPQFYALGYNVLLLRLPHHGLADRSGPTLGELRAEAMVARVNEAIDLLHGLGEQVTVLGFSLGGVLAGWVAQHRGDVARAVLVSPAVGLKTPQLRRQRLAANVLALLPDRFLWWEPEREADKLGPRHVYWGFSTHALSELLRMANLVLHEAQQARPAVRELVVVVNPTDELVEPRAVSRLVAAWRAQGAAVDEQLFPAEWQLRHDLIDPEQEHAQVGRVYPLVAEWGTGVGQ
jgi:carboxylesterase